MKQYLQRMERVIAQAEELHSNTVVHSTSSARRQNLNRRLSYSTSSEAADAQLKKADLKSPVRLPGVPAAEGSTTKAAGHQPQHCRMPSQISKAAASTDIPVALTAREQCLSNGHEGAAGSASNLDLLNSAATLHDWIADSPNAQPKPSTDHRCKDASALITESGPVNADLGPGDSSEDDSVLLASPIRGELSLVLLKHCKDLLCILVLHAAVR